MSDRLLKESDVLRIAFQLPLVVNSAFADAVKALPSADRPQGKWKFSSTVTDLWGNELEKVKCSHCGYETLAISRIVKDGNFCLNCSAKMIGADDE